MQCLLRICYLTVLIGAAYSLQTIRHIKSSYATIGTYRKSPSRNFILLSTTSSTNDSVQSNEEQHKRYPIGSQPEFAIPDDSTIETPMQRRFLWAHFGMLFYNIYLVVSSLDLSTFLPMDVLKYCFLVLFSVVLGDFAVSIAIPV